MGAIWTILRLCGIVVGVATLLRLAKYGFGVEYKAFFQVFLDQVRNIVELGFLLDPIETLIRSTLAWIHSLGWSVPSLDPVWRPTFSLLWLWMLSWVRNLSVHVALPVWAAACALVTSIAVGLDRPLLYIFSVAGFLFFAGTLRWFNDVSVVRWRATIFLGFAACLFGFWFFLRYFIGAATDLFSMPQRELDERSSLTAVERFGFNLMQLPDVAILALFVAFLAAFTVTIGVIIGGKTWRERWGNAATATGLDILGVMGLALAIGYVMMK